MSPSLRLPVTVAAASNSSAPAVLAPRPSAPPSNQVHPDLAMHAMSMTSLGSASVAATAAAATALTQLPLPQSSAGAAFRAMPAASDAAAESASAPLASSSAPAAATQGAAAAQAAAAAAFAHAAVQSVTAQGVAAAMSSAPRRPPPGAVAGDPLLSAVSCRVLTRSSSFSSCTVHRGHPPTFRDKHVQRPHNDL